MLENKNVNKNENKNGNKSVDKNVNKNGKKKAHRNIPIFIPHLGCPNMCVFCNQRSISGKTCFERERVRADIEAALETIPCECEVEIAYFGGSFTGIDRDLMIYLLDVAQSFVDDVREDRARVMGIRMSTRPDYIDGEILDILGRYSVKTIELGLQSMNDRVLTVSRRGHTAEQAERACRMIVERGYSLVGQMMIGLPASTPEDEIYTAELICDMGATGARIYPTVVFYGTELADMALRGEYSPLDNEDAVIRAARALEVFDRRGVECIRIGLCASENLSDESCVLGGANHPAMGELVLGELMFRKMTAHIESRGCDTSGAEIHITVPRGSLSVYIGQRGRNRDRIKEMFGASRVVIKEGDVCEMSAEICK